MICEFNKAFKLYESFFIISIFYAKIYNNFQLVRFVNLLYNFETIFLELKLLKFNNKVLYFQQPVWIPETFTHFQQFSSHISFSRSVIKIVKQAP